MGIPRKEMKSGNPLTAKRETKGEEETVLQFQPTVYMIQCASRSPSTFPLTSHRKLLYFITHRGKSVYRPPTDSGRGNYLGPRAYTVYAENIGLVFGIILYS